MVETGQPIKVLRNKHQNIMSKKILISLSIVGVVAAIGIGGTIAYFNDTETSTGNTFSAGNLDLQVVFPYGGEPYAGFPGTQIYKGENIPPVEINDIKPGDEGVLRYHINNIGTIGGEISITLSNITNSPGVTPEPEPLPDNGELGYYLKYNIGWAPYSYSSPSNQKSSWATGPANPPYGPFRLMELSSNTYGGFGWDNTLDPGEEYGFFLCVKLDGDLQTWNGYGWSDFDDNIIQLDSVEFDIIFHLDQS